MLDTLSTVAANRKTEPAKLSGLMRGELDWIVLKAMEKDRNRRYETANGLAADIQRYLNDQPVKTPTAVQSLSFWQVLSPPPRVGAGNHRRRGGPVDRPDRSDRAVDTSVERRETGAADAESGAAPGEFRSQCAPHRGKELPTGSQRRG